MPRVFALAGGVVLCAMWPRTAEAEPEVASDTALQWYDVRSPSGQTLLTRRRLTTSLGVSGYDLLRDDAGRDQGDRASFLRRGEVPEEPIAHPVEAGNDSDHQGAGCVGGTQRCPPLEIRSEWLDRLLDELPRRLDLATARGQYADGWAGGVKVPGTISIKGAGMGASFIDGSGSVHRAVGTEVKIGVGLRILGFSEAQGIGGEFDGGDALRAKGGGDVAMEELVLSAEGLDLAS